MLFFGRKEQPAQRRPEEVEEKNNAKEMGKTEQSKTETESAITKDTVTTQENKPAPETKPAPHPVKTNTATPSVQETKHDRQPWYASKKEPVEPDISGEPTAVQIVFPELGEKVVYRILIMDPYALHGHIVDQLKSGGNEIGGFLLGKVQYQEIENTKQVNEVAFVKELFISYNESSGASVHLDLNERVYNRSAELGGEIIGAVHSHAFSTSKPSPSGVDTQPIDATENLVQFGQWQLIGSDLYIPEADLDNWPTYTNYYGKPRSGEVQAKNGVSSGDITNSALPKVVGLIFNVRFYPDRQHPASQYYEAELRVRTVLQDNGKYAIVRYTIPEITIKKVTENIFGDIRARRSFHSGYYGSYYRPYGYGGHYGTWDPYRPSTSYWGSNQEVKNYDPFRLSQRQKEKEKTLVKPYTTIPDLEKAFAGRAGLQDFVNRFRRYVRIVQSHLYNNVLLIPRDLTGLELILKYLEASDPAAITYDFAIDEATQRPMVVIQPKYGVTVHATPAYQESVFEATFEQLLQRLPNTLEVNGIYDVTLRSSSGAVKLKSAREVPVIYVPFSSGSLTFTLRPQEDEVAVEPIEDSDDLIAQLEIVSDKLDASRDAVDTVLDLLTRIEEKLNTKQLPDKEAQELRDLLLTTKRSLHRLIEGIDAANSNLQDEVAKNLEEIAARLENIEPLPF